MGKGDIVLARTAHLPEQQRVHVAKLERHRPLARPHVHGKSFLAEGDPLQIRGVTYGPFATNSAGERFPVRRQIDEDFTSMCAVGLNAIRTYHTPSSDVFEAAEAAGLRILIDAPWGKHLCFLESRRTQREAREAVRNLASEGNRRGCVLAYSIGNEIPTDVVRWHGAQRVQRFLSELADTARQADPDGLVTYSNFPPTEYLELPFLDFLTFNVYLHDREAFRRYLIRLLNLAGDKPLLLGELGLDTLRHGEIQQAEFLVSHLREAALLGLAGSFVFSWTDDWHTGGYAIDDWAFGITCRDRSPKASMWALQETFEESPAEMLAETPLVSVIVCSYNGGATLEQCLRSLAALDYPNYEVIVVNDGSTDDTRSILSQFPAIRVIHQENLGLSAARNAGLHAATGEIIAYTDSDCFAEPGWLTHLVHRFQHTDAAAVGGPNLSPDDGWIADCVAASPGQPMHVLESDHVAEHIPGCNMAFRRESLLAIGGFDIQFRKAGDDVDLCWRLQQAGYWITFAPGACVWHHRRQTPRAYLRQQAGYGEAEALLRFKHPERFNARGESIWRGLLYGTSLRGLYLRDAVVNRGVFASGLFQCLYQSQPAHWAMLPSSFEWLTLTACAVLAAIRWPTAGAAAAVMWGLSVLVAVLQARQAQLRPSYDSLRSRLLVMALSYTQPLVRAWSRYRTRLFAYRHPRSNSTREPSIQRLPLSGRRTAAYWTEVGAERLELLTGVISFLNENRWTRTIDSGCRDWDLEIHCSHWAVVQVCTVQEEHGNGKRLIQARFRLRSRGYVKLIAWAALSSGVVALLFPNWPAMLAAACLGTAVAGAWIVGIHQARLAMSVFDNMALQLGLLRCETGSVRRTEGAA
jgi:O-antigen biosynthesis protein